MNNKDKSFTEGLNQHATAIAKPEHFQPAKRENSSIAATLNVRPEFNINDFDKLRPGSTIPSNINQIMAMSEDFYNRTYTYRSIVDLVVEIIIDGLQIVDSDPELQNFYNVWGQKIDIMGRAAHFVRDLAKSGNTIVQRYMTDLPLSRQNKWKNNQVLAAENKLGNNVIPNIQRKSIPIKYRFYRPSSVELVGGYAGALSNKQIYGIRVPSKVYTDIHHAKTKLEEKVINKIPKEIIDAAESNKGSYIVVPLTTEDLYVAHYNKDDSDIWAFPLAYSVLTDLIFNENLRKVKNAGLEGWYNSIGLWKLGDHKEGILPTPGMADKLRSILVNNTGGGKIDIIWDSMISYEEHYPPIQELAGFEENKTAILIAFGVPEEGMGGESSQSGNTNAALRLKNFAKKAQTFRTELTRWLMTELAIIVRNLGFDHMPFIKYNYDNLMDDRVYYTLFQGLRDRGVISDKTLLEKMKEIPQLEQERLAKETEMRDKGELPPLVGPFQKDPVMGSPDSGGKQNGRPPASKDTYQRQRKINKIPTKAESLVKANDIYNYVSEQLTEIYINKYEVKDVRSLTGKQKEELENMKNFVFSNYDIDEPIDDNILNNIIINPNIDIYKSFSDEFNRLLKASDTNKLTTKNRNQLKIEAYCANLCII